MIDENKLIEDIDNEYDLHYGEILINPNRFVNMVENQPQVHEIIRTPEEIALYMSDECDDCPCGTYEICKKEVFPNDDLSDVCIKHRINWLAGK